jgi:putative heme d1 biosynthesis radical SAM protein NirJ2
MFVSWNVTKRCNLSCEHCYRDAGDAAPQELNTVEAKHLIFELHQTGCKRIIFSGGEPLLREDIYELIEYATSIGIRSVLGTNGMLITYDVAKKLKQSGITRVGISIDSTKAQLHDKFRRYEGAFEQTLDGIYACKQVGVEFQIHTTVMDFNLDDIFAISDMAYELGAKAHHIFFLVPTGRALQITTRLTHKTYYQLLKKILDEQKRIISSGFEIKPTCAPQFMVLVDKAGITLSYRFTRGCLAGISYCCILPDGDVSPCPYLPVSIGNVRMKSFSVLWKEASDFLLLRSSRYTGRCNTCRYRELCGGCRAKAYYYSENKDYMADDPWCIIKQGKDVKVFC